MFSVEGGTQFQMKRPTKPGYWTYASKNTDVIKREIDDWLYKELNGIVQNGPFTGMKILKDTSWKETRLAPMILGTYEEELHGELERQINRLKRLERPKISVLGCSEGYYAIGLKLRIPQAEVFIVDSDDKALEVCERAAQANEVTLIRGAPVNVVMENTDFMFMDVEGAEVEYLDTEQFPSLKQVTAIVEIHNFPATDTSPGQKTDDILLERFRGTHRIQFVLEGPRDPNRYPWLLHMINDYRWLALSEGRTCFMGWFVMHTKGMSLS